MVPVTFSATLTLGMAEIQHFHYTESGAQKNLFLRRTPENGMDRLSIHLRHFDLCRRLRFLTMDHAVERR